MKDDEPVFEEYWSAAIDADPSGDQPPAFYFWASLVGLTRTQTRKIRVQAETAVGRYAESERALILHTYRAIVQVTTVRLEKGGWAPANAYIVRVPADPTDPLDQIRDDRGTVLSWALRFAEDQDELVAKFWREVASGFKAMHFSGRPE